MKPSEQTRLARRYLRIAGMEAGRTAEWLKDVPTLLAADRKSMQADLLKLAKEGDFMTILETELAVVRLERAQVANSPIMQSSLSDAEKELLAAIACHLKLKDRPEEYKQMDREEYPTAKYLRKGLPNDPAHKGIAAQKARLRDSRKQRLAVDDKDTRRIRGQALTHAQEIHFALQEQVLGRARTS